MTMCFQCRVQLGCGCNFEDSTKGKQPLASGVWVAMCKVCFLRSQGKSEAQIDDELREIAFDIKAAQQS